MRISIGANRIGSIPLQHRANFQHLTLDIAWFGVLNGSTIAFAAVYAARQGANALQLGLLSATPALITLMLALPAGSWLRNKPVSRSTYLASIGHRWFYLLWVFLPLAFAPSVQVWALILITALMSIPGTAMAISFNALFAGSVPPEYRASLAGIRNAAFALTSIIVTLLCGWLLDNLSFPLGYQVVFAIGFIAAMLSSYHLKQVHPLKENWQPTALKARTRDWAPPGINHFWHNMRTSFGLRLFIKQIHKPRINLRLVVDNRRFGMVLLLILSLHLALTMVHPLLPIYLVDQVRFSDQEIAMGNSAFYLAIFLGSMQLARVSKRFGHRRTLAVGMMLTCFYPLLIARTQALPEYILASVMGGLAWSLAGGALGNFILEEIPEEEQAHHLAWYNIALQAGVLFGALIAPLFVTWVGIGGALIIAAGGRLLTGVGLWRLRMKQPETIKA